MKKPKMWGIGLIVLGVLSAGTVLRAQGESTSKAPMYIYVSQWGVSRAQWGAMAKVGEQQGALEDKLQADGTIMGYGHYVNLIHSEGQPTHGGWIMATSEGNVLKALAAFYGAPQVTSPVLAASKHRDLFLVSRIYNSRPGTFDGAYLSGSLWEVKPGQMEAFQAIVKARVVPVLEKELADGALVSYSVDTQDYHTESPGLVEVVFIATDAAAFDKVDGAFEAAFGKDTEIGPAVAALTVRKDHRDFLYRVTHMVIK
ncbi:MAG: hypothetical protein P8Z30_08695 [Acidobacteriota bacterium]